MYEIAPTTVIQGDQVYKNHGWFTVGYFKCDGEGSRYYKTNTSVFPEKRGEGYCARLDTRMESVKVLGLVNITVLAAGSIFTGTVHEPIKGTKNPQKMLQTGIPFTKKPVALQFDYKVKMSDRENPYSCYRFQQDYGCSRKRLSGSYPVFAKTLGRCQRKCLCQTDRDYGDLLLSFYRLEK